MLPRRHILIFHQAALGDFIMTWPLAMALGRVFAQSRVMYVTGADKGRLAEDVIGVESLSADDGWHALHGDNVEPSDRIRRLLAGTQCAILFAENDEPAFVANLAQYAGDIPLIRIRPNPPPGVHVMAHQLSQLDADGKLKGYVEQMQTLVRTSGITARPAVANDTVVIHPGSGSSAKNWPINSYLALATALRERGRKVTIALGEVERDQFDAATLAALELAGNVVQPADLPALRKTLAAAGAYVGNDSGPTHLAGALGLRTIALFGPASSVDQWQPVGPHVAVLPFDSTVETVVDALKK